MLNILLKIIGFSLSLINYFYAKLCFCFELSKKNAIFVFKIEIKEDSLKWKGNVFL